MIARIISVALFCAGLFCLAQAQIPMTGAGTATPGGITPLSQWVAAVIAAGGSVSGTQQTRVGTLITALQANNIFTCDGFWLFDAENSQQTQIDIVNRATWAVTTATVTLGATGSSISGGNGIVNSSINLFSATNYKQNSGTLFFYETIVDTSGSDVTPLGADNGTAWATIEERAVATAGAGINVTTGDFGVVGVTHTTGLFVASRTNSTGTGDVLTVFNAGNTSGISSTGSGDTSQAPPNLNAFLFSRNNSGTAGGTTSVNGATMAAMGICSGFNSTQVTALSTALNGGYLTARGHNVY